MTTGHETTDKILDHNRLQLSALIDGELPPDAARFLLRRLQYDTELGGCWERWQLCGDVLRGHVGIALPVDFAGRLGERIRLESHAVSKHAAGRRPVIVGARRLRWGGGMALAASVAVIAMLLVRQSPDAASPDARAPVRVAAALPAAGTKTHSVPTVPATALPGRPDRADQVLTAVAAADVPRRLMARRSRGQSQRAALRSGIAPTTTQAPVPANAVAIGTVARLADPFAARQPNLTSRPWPRALLPGAAAGGAYTVDYGGRSSAASPSFYPFEPRTLPSMTAIPTDGDDPP